MPFIVGHSSASWPVGRTYPVACRRAARFGATVLPPPGGRLGRPDVRAATARSAACRSPAQLASSGRRSAPLRPRSAPRWRSLVEFVASALRPCGPSSASLPFTGRPLPPPASANPRAGLRRRGAGFSPRAPFAARAANRVHPSLSARRLAVPPAPHVTFCTVRRRESPLARRSQQSHERTERIAHRLRAFACRDASCRGEWLVTSDRLTCGDGGDSSEDGSRDLSGRRAKMRTSVPQEEKRTLVSAWSRG